MVYLITYDLKKPGQDYSNVYDAIKSCGTWWHYLKSTWLVDDYLTAEQISARISNHIDQNDRLFVIGITDDYAGWLPKDAWEWINAHVHQHA